MATRTPTVNRNFLQRKCLSSRKAFGNVSNVASSTQKNKAASAVKRTISKDEKPVKPINFVKKTLDSCKSKPVEAKVTKETVSHEEAECDIENMFYCQPSDLYHSMVEPLFEDYHESLAFDDDFSVSKPYETDFILNELL